MRRQQNPAGSAASIAAAWSRVADFVSAVESSLDRFLAETFRVSLVEFRALAALEASPDRELRVNVLAARVGLSESSATRLLSRLEAKGLGTREFCADDRRGIYAALTPRGREQVRQLRGAYERRVHELLMDTTTTVGGPNLNELTRSFGDVSAALDR